MGSPSSAVMNCPSFENLMSRPTAAAGAISSRYFSTSVRVSGSATAVVTFGAGTGTGAGAAVGFGAGADGLECSAF